MAYDIFISKEAQVELGIAECYFKAKSLQKPFLEDFSKQLQFLKATPESFQIKYNDIRIICFESFNYSIHYVIREKNVLILRILNQRQHF